MIKIIKIISKNLEIKDLKVFNKVAGFSNKDISIIVIIVIEDLIHNHNKNYSFSNILMMKILNKMKQKKNKKIMNGINSTKK